jgi:PAS domain S-box-containing protein
MSSQPLRILLIDDDLTVLAILRYILEQEQYSILEASCGRQGLCCAQAEQPDLILLDINMPDLSGFEVCKRLKANQETSEIPIIFLTAAGQEENEYQGFLEGAIDFLRKPVNRTPLCMRVKNVLAIQEAKKKLEQQARDLRIINERLKEALIQQEHIRRNLLQRDQILCAINYVAKFFLQTQQWQDGIDHVLAYLAQTVNCEQAYLKIFSPSLGVQAQYSWSQHGQNRLLSLDLLMTETRQDAKALFPNASPMILPNASLNPSLSKKLAQQKIHSALLLPVYVKDSIYACLGFDSSISKRNWESSLVRALMISTDIVGTAIQRTLDSQERHQLAAALNEFADCVVMTDPQGCILYANPATEKVTGYLPQDLLGCPFTEIQSFGESSFAEILEHILHQGEWQGEVFSRHKDGSLYRELLKIVPVHGEDRAINSLCIIKADQTEKKQLEAIAEAANLMENVGFIFSGIRHELGNPLNSMKMALSVLRRQVEESSPATVREFIDRSLSEVHRMEYLLYSLKNFNHLEEQHIVSEDLCTFLEQCRRLHEPSLQEKGIELKLLYETSPIYALVDSRALHQVLLNLLTNAIQAVEKNPQPMISIHVLHKKRNFVQILFQDNGCGFSEAVQGQLFKPFFTTKVNGSGLGLTIVKKMLTAMHCTVHMEGKEGKGASVLITLPKGENPRKE